MIKIYKWRPVCIKIANKPEWEHFVVYVDNKNIPDHVLLESEREMMAVDFGPSEVEFETDKNVMIEELKKHIERLGEEQKKIWLEKQECFVELQRLEGQCGITMKL